MHTRRFTLLLAGGLVTLATADQALAGGCGSCGGGRNYAVGGPSHVVAYQGTFTTGASYAAAPTTTYQAAPSMAYTPGGGPSYRAPGAAFANPDGFGNRGVTRAFPPGAGRSFRRGR